MYKQQPVLTSLGTITISSLTLGELRQLDALFSEKPESKGGIGGLLKYLPIIFASARKIQQDLTLEQLENGLTLEDFNVLFNAVLEVSGLKKADSPGEANHVMGVPI